MREPMTEGVSKKLIDRGNRWQGGDTGWDVHHAVFAREFGQVYESAGQEPGLYSSGRSSPVDPLAESKCSADALGVQDSEPIANLADVPLSCSCTFRVRLLE